MRNHPGTVGLMRKGTVEPSPKQKGGEQGDPMMPLLFSIGIQQALEEVAAAMLPREQVETDFGQTDFGQTDFGQTDFGQTDFGQRQGFSCM